MSEMCTHWWWTADQLKANGWRYQMRLGPCSVVWSTADGRSPEQHAIGSAEGAWRQAEPPALLNNAEIDRRLANLDNFLGGDSVTCAWAKRIVETTVGFARGRLPIQKVIEVVYLG